MLASRCKPELHHSQPCRIFERHLQCCRQSVAPGSFSVSASSFSASARPRLALHSRPSIPVRRRRPNLFQKVTGLCHAGFASLILYPSWLISVGIAKTEAVEACSRPPTPPCKGFTGLSRHCSLGNLSLQPLSPIRYGIVLHMCLCTVCSWLPFLCRVYKGNWLCFTCHSWPCVRPLTDSIVHKAKSDMRNEDSCLCTPQ